MGQTLGVALAFFAVSVLRALFTLNALWPVRRPDALTIPSFFAGWLTSELPFHHLAWQLAATLVWIAIGALQSWPGVAGLIITLISWVGIGVLIRRSALAPAVLEEALRAGFAPHHPSQIDATRVGAWGPALQWRQIARPIVRRD